MLIFLSFFDTWYLFGSILESFRKSFNLETDVHIQLFPYLLYPGQMVMMMCSVYMTVAIAIERFSAVRYPLSYNQVSKVWIYNVTILQFATEERDRDYFRKYNRQEIPSVLLLETLARTFFFYFFVQLIR